MNKKLQKALNHPLWLSHKPGKRYSCERSGVDGKEWEIWYYPLFECGRTGEKYSEPRALIGMPKFFKGEQGFDLREVPLRYLH